MMLGDRSIEANIGDWGDCQQCPEFVSCYNLCLAKVTLGSVVATQCHPSKQGIYNYDAASLDFVYRQLLPLSNGRSSLEIAR
jgi:hypothetical protein